MSCRLNEYELRASLIFVPGRRFTSPAARAAAGPTIRVDAAIEIDRARNPRRRVLSSIVFLRFAVSITHTAPVRMPSHRLALLRTLQPSIQRPANLPLEA